MKIFLSLLFTTLLLTSQGQEGFRQKNLLLDQLRSTTSNEQRINLNLTLGELLIDKDSSGLEHCKDAIFLVNKLSIDKRKLALAHSLMARYLEPNAADSVNRVALRYAQIYHQDTLRADLLLSIGDAFLKKLSFDSAYSYYQSALHVFDSLKVKSSTLYMSLGKATSSSFNADLDLAVSYMKQAEQIFIEEVNTEKLSEAYNTIGFTFYKNKWLDRSPTLWKDSALLYLNKSIEYGSEVDMLNQSLLASNYRLKGLVYTEADEFEKAKINLEKALKVAGSIPGDKNIPSIYYAYGLLYSKTGRFSEAKDWVLKGRQISKRLDPNNIDSYSLYLLYDISLKQGDYKSALTYFQRQEALKDSIFTERRKVLNEELEVRYETELQKAQNKALSAQTELQKKTINSQRALIILAIVGLAVVALLGSFIYRQLRVSRKLSLLLNEQNLKLIETKETIERQRDKLVELDSTKSRFFSNISHDLRSPLTLILNAFDEIKEHNFRLLEKESKLALEVGVRNGKRLLHLAEEIMELTRLEEGKIKLKPKFVAIGPYTRMLTKMLYSAADAKLITLDFKDELPVDTSIWLDPMQYEKILYNLISNAIKFTPNEGHIEVKLHLEFDHLNLSVKDTGSGIPKKSIDHIFDRYYQSRANETTAHVGVGIGLALVKELVDLHEGLIEVRSSNEGSCFQVSFPFKMKENSYDVPVLPESSLDISSRESLWSDLYQADERIQVPSLSNPNTETPTILIVEDHKEIREYLSHILKDEYRVCEAQDGRAALEVLKRRKIDLIISDLMMPLMDGFELVSALKTDKTHARIPVLVLSARAIPSEKLDLLEKGADAILYKPCEKRELLAQTANLLAKSYKWDGDLQLEKLYQPVDEYEKTMLSKLESLIVRRIDDQNLSVNDLAEEMAASESKMYRFVKNKTGLSPLEYIKEIRLQYVRKYLENNQVRSLIEAAKKIGMNNATYFKQQYTKRFGRPPQTMAG